MKILSPAGNMDSLRAAIKNGADEVYLGINNFNARNIDGFSLENLQQAVDFAHLFNVKVLLAINILFTNDEMQSAVDTAVAAYNMGIDAMIVQDLGLAKLLHENYPEIELHASTQMAICNLEGVQEILKYGFRRVVLARETSLEEIKKIKNNSKIEIEYFAHGALCVSFSGNCYLSSYLTGASGNRGKCKQLCRLPYTFLHKNKELKKGYLLSAKDFCMLDRLEELQRAGVDVLKIEGRARRPFYVAQTTKQYKNKLNNLPTNKTDLELAFNRGFTAGYFDGNDNIISDFQNHIGILAGKVTNFEQGKKFNTITLECNRKISAKSVLKFYDNNKEIATISAYDIKGTFPTYKVTTTATVCLGNVVRLISDFDLESAIASETQKRLINATIVAKPNENLHISAQIDGNFIELLGEKCEKAQKQPLTKADFVQNFAKSEFFEVNLVFDIENVFIPKKVLNEFRRNFFDKIYETLTVCHHHQLQTIIINKPNKLNKLEDFEFIHSLNQPFCAKNIIFSPEIYNLEDVISFSKICEKLGKKAILDTPNFATEKDIKLLKNIINSTKICILANNYYALSLSSNFAIGAGLNVYNGYSPLCDFEILTAELEQSCKFPYMTLRHCPLKNHIGATCNNCPFDDDYSYKMDNGKILKLKRKKLSSCTFYLTD